jgi:hypothetical protein
MQLRSLRLSAFHAQGDRRGPFRDPPDHRQLFRWDHFTFDPKMIQALKKSDDIVFLACGTSHYASLLGVDYMHYLGKRSESYIASEWAYYPNVTAKNPVYILLSQSGETADLIACQKYLNENGLTNIALTNTRGSTIDRKASYSLLIFAGLEVAVAATKSYDAQVTMLRLIDGCPGWDDQCGPPHPGSHLRHRGRHSRREEIHARSPNGSQKPAMPSSSDAATITKRPWNAL